MNIPEHPRAENPTVDEVRRVRSLIWMECGRDMNKHFADLQRIEAAERARGRQIVPAPPRPEQRAAG